MDYLLQRYAVGMSCLLAILCFAACFSCGVVGWLVVGVLNFISIADGSIKLFWGIGEQSWSICYMNSYE